MKAIQSKKYGSPDVFQLSELQKPIPQANEILVRNYATTVTAADIMMRTGLPVIGRLYTGLRKPKRTVLGFEFAGEVVEVGNSVSLFKVGDKVFGGTTKLGVYAEFVCVSEKDVITTMPDNISYAEAAPVNGSAITVMNFLVGKGKIQKGQKVLINGASGALGTYAIQIAKHYGAEVTGVCSTQNVDLVKSLGADFVIDYTKSDFTKNTNCYDLIFDTVGKSSFTKSKNALTQKGIYLSSVMSPTLLRELLCSRLFSRKKAITSATGLLPVKIRLAYFLELKELLKNGTLKTIIDRQVPLEQMADAHRYVEEEHKRGNLIITL
jgi:NADPH:quinone reductase-like Zn-dependent oxidoreductase